MVAKFLEFNRLLLQKSLEKKKKKNNKKSLYRMIESYTQRNAFKTQAFNFF